MEMIAFWIAAGGMGLAILALFVLALIRARAEIASASEYDLKVYRDQLAEIDRDLARGTLPADEADRQRTEVSRRLLEADRARSAGDTSRQHARHRHRRHPDPCPDRQQLLGLHPARRARLSRPAPRRPPCHVG